MRVQLRVSNTRDVRPNYRYKYTLTARGGVIGSASDVDWQIQDRRNSMPDYAVRIEYRQPNWLMTGFDGAAIYINESQSPLRPNKTIILRLDDRIKIGSLNFQLGEWMDETEGLPKYHDAVELGKLVNYNHNVELLSGGASKAGQSIVPEHESWSQDHKWHGREIVETDTADVMDSLTSHQPNKPRPRTKPNGQWEQFFDDLSRPTDLLANTAEPAVLVSPQPVQTNPRVETSASFSDLPTFDVNDELEPFTGPAQIEDVPYVEISSPAHSPFEQLVHSMGLEPSDIPSEQQAQFAARVGSVMRAVVVQLHCQCKDFERATGSTNSGNPVSLADTPNDAMRQLFVSDESSALALDAVIREILDEFRSTANPTNSNHQNQG